MSPTTYRDMAICARILHYRGSHVNSFVTFSLQIFSIKGQNQVSSLRFHRNRVFNPLDNFRVVVYVRLFVYTKDALVCQFFSRSAGSCCKTGAWFCRGAVISTRVLDILGIEIWAMNTLHKYASESHAGRMLFGAMKIFAASREIRRSSKITLA